MSAGAIVSQSLSPTAVINWGGGLEEWETRGVGGSGGGS